MNGVQAFYVTKYSSKDTQKEDTKDYAPAMTYLEERLSRKKFENPNSEAVSRLIGASIAH